MPKKKVLICPPTYYDIRYSINPWMKVGEAIDRDKLQRTYEEIKRIYQNLGVEIHEITPDPELPDMCYSANYGLIKDNIFIPSNFRFPERAREAAIAAKYFQEKFGFEIKKLPENIYFEGQAELLPTDGIYFFGWGKRSSQEAKTYLEELLKKPIIDVHLIDPYYYHLDTCFVALSEDVALVNPKAFSPEDLEKIKSKFQKVVFTNAIDNKIMACNLVKIEKNLIIAKGLSDELKTKLLGLGYTLHEIDMSEYLKGGGSIKCITLEF
jgi:N-dimethylarginine dimethylaminohydrolase